ncbi:peptidase S8/S53 domain-containing protein [Ochromonadaceae sp. CCMP2298]|nr:peptidase S8/S53 domain-containing protein [Ochromonadaceae sp. CCMP2298]
MQLILGSFAVCALLWSLAPAMAVDVADLADVADGPSFHRDSNMRDFTTQANEWPLMGPWIVEVALGQNDLAMSECRAKSGKVKYNFQEDGLNALVVQGVSKTDLEQMQGVLKVTPDFLLYASAYSWGNDRVDQPSLPLDRANYRQGADYCGTGVDVFVLDTGIDTTHTEFSSNARTVTNIWNSYGAITTNTDGNGHGTHVAGTVGGRTIGIARCANIYGMKVLSDSGSGSFSSILAAMNEVLRLHQLGGRKSVISMSLGGGCSGSCQDDLLVNRVNFLAGLGVISVVAAGNDGAATQFTTPAAAGRAITVGASRLANFSNWGSIVDVNAPGVGIRSAKTGGGYVSYSGTSMACPHVTGIVAQNLEKGGITMNSLAAVLTVTNALQCDVSNVIIHTRGGTTHALALIPSDDGIFGTC